MVPYKVSIYYVDPKSNTASNAGNNVQVYRNSISN